MTEMLIAVFVKDGKRIYDLIYHPFGLSIIQSAGESEKSFGELTERLYYHLNLSTYEIYPSNQTIEILNHLIDAGLSIQVIQGKIDVFKLDALVRKWLEIKDIVKNLIPKTTTDGDV
jgi:hypothetical protein